MTKNENYKLTNLLIELTKSCNEKCSHCYIPKDTTDNKYIMPSTNAFNYINQASKIGVQDIAFSGGEPFLHKDILDIIQYTYNYNFDNIYILSNLTLIKDDDINILKTFENLTIQTTLFSTSPAIHDELTGLIGAHARTVRMLEKLKQNGIKIQVSCPILQQNSSSFRDLQKWVDKKGYSFYPNFDIVAQTNFDTTNQNSILTSEQKVSLIKDLVLIDNHPYWSKWKDLINKEEKFILNENPCEAGINQLVISANGNVQPCMLWEKGDIGNLNDEKLETIWNDSISLNAIRNIHHMDFNFNNIDIDSLKYIKICFARNANSNNGDFLHISEEDFKYAKLLKKMVKELNQ